MKAIINNNKNTNTLTTAEIGNIVSDIYLRDLSNFERKAEIAKHNFETACEIFEINVNRLGYREKAILCAIDDEWTEFENAEHRVLCFKNDRFGRFYYDQKTNKVVG